MSRMVWTYRIDPTTRTWQLWCEDEANLKAICVLEARYDHQSDPPIEHYAQFIVDALNEKERYERLIAAIAVAAAPTEVRSGHIEWWVDPGQSIVIDGGTRTARFVPGEPFEHEYAADPDAPTFIPLEEETR